MSNKSDSIYMSAALHYAQKFGWAVFPVSKDTKKPHTPHGCKDAKTDPGAIRSWWNRYPDASIGVATGSVSNLLVIDLDVDENKGLDGIRELRVWEKDNGELPETVRAITGRGGCHYYYHYDGKDLGNRAGVLDGVDVRGEGGYVIAPPSLHPNGTSYEWENDPDEVDLAPVDNIVMKLLAVGKHTEASEPFKLPDKIGMGKRNDTMYRLACSLQSKGMTDDAILAAVNAENVQRCDPPLEEPEIAQIVGSALRYTKGTAEIIERSGEYHPPEIQYKIDKNGDLTTTPIQSIQNAMEAIEYDKKLFGRIFYNEMSYSPCVYDALPWNHSTGWRYWDNADDTNLKAYIENKYGLRSMDRIMDALNNVIHKHPFNPVQEMLKAAHKDWDGNKHVENLLPMITGADKTDYNTAVIHLFMLGAVHRAFHPGCKFDVVPILVGDQGKYKSSFLRFLAVNDEWFDDNFNSLDGDKASERLQGRWIVELAELQATKRAKDIETIKAFITSQEDTYRPPYARRPEQRKRRCVLAGTSNPVDFLVDKTGNRRFLPVICAVNDVPNPHDHEAEIRGEVIQAWGEIMDEYMRKGGKVRLVLPDNMQKEALEMQERFLEEDPDIGIIQGWLDENEGTDRVCAVMLWKEALHREYERYTRKDINTIHEIMKNNITGWHYAGKFRCGKYGMQRCYERDDSEVFEDVEDLDTIPFE